jgi:membrane dipeptidase
MKSPLYFFIICIASSLSMKGQISNSTKKETKYVIDETNAKRIVADVLKTSPVIDGHNDLLIHYFDCKTCPRELADYRIDSINKGQTDIPRLKKGHVGGQLMNVFGETKELTSYLQAWDFFYRMAETYKKDLQIVGTAAEMRATMKEGKIALLPILEGAVRIQNNLALLRVYYKLGLRSVTFAYKTNDLADGSDDSAKHNGLSAFGKLMIQEMNRLGIIVDMSHISAKAMSDILDVTKSPVIFSHSNVRALCNVNRNVPDDILKRLKNNKGLIMLTFVPEFTNSTFSKWYFEGDSLYTKLNEQYAGDRNKINPEMELWEKSNPQPVVTIADIAEHFEYVKQLIGIDFIGIGGDYDGIDYTITGLEDVSTFPNLLIELARRGWTESELRKISSENFLRVFEEIEKRKETLQVELKPSLTKYKN